MTASQQHYWEMGSSEWVAVAYLAYMGEPPLFLPALPTLPALPSLYSIDIHPNSATMNIGSY